MLKLNLGLLLKPIYLKEGDIADVTADSKGKGFAGVIKRHNFAGLRHTHGTPQNQRSAGSIGACAYPGRVWKGQKMAGRYGGKTSTIQGLEVIKIDIEKNIIFIKGSVPGSKGALVYVNHTRKG
jgi:50S ribosomal protein L3, bacterial